jgi:redox-sensitive bicupin YhaK (pirin superfamily)
VTVLAGSAFGCASPAEVYSPLLGLDLSAAGKAELRLPLTAAFEHAALVLAGTVSVAGEALAPGTLLYFAPGREELMLGTAAAARILLIGGTPFGEEILVWWNFVARTREEMAAATRDWNAGRFGAVRGSPAPALIAPDLAGIGLRSGPPGVT